MFLSREQILAAEDLKREEVPCPEWGGTVLMQTMSADKRDEIESFVLSRREAAKDGTTESPHKGLRARMVAACAVDQHGKLLFTAEDLEALGGKSALVLDRLFAVAQSMNGMKQEDVEELTGNSSDGQSDDSTSA